MSNLPSSWEWSSIGNLTVYIQRGKSPKYAERSDLPVVNQRCVRWNQLEQQHLKFIHPDQFSAWDSARYIRAGDVLWNSTGTGTVGRAYLVKAGDCIPPKVVDSHVTIVRHAPEVDPRYLFNWIRSPTVQDKIEEMCDGTTNQIELSRVAIAATAIPIAPAAEQTRIADQLDTLLARIQACNDRLDAIPALLKRFRQAVLDAATSGDLLEANSAPAPLVALRTVLAEPMRNGKSVRGGSGMPVLRLTSLKHSGIDLNETKTGDWIGVSDVQRFLVRNGDYLVSRGNGSRALVGRGGLVAECDSDIAFPDTMIRIRPDTSRLLPDYLKFVWGAPVVRRQIEAAAKTTAGIWKVSQPDLEGVMIPLPLPEEQAAIVQRVQALLGLAVRIESRHAKGMKQAQRLTPLTLAKAFRGELVSQDPNDEPASALLAKLNAAHTNAVAEPSRRRSKTPGKRPTMSNVENGTIKAAILKLKTDRFSFEELRAQVSGDYEQLRAALFELLEEPSPVVRQVFDEKAKAIQLVRVKP